MRDVEATRPTLRFRPPLTGGPTHYMVMEEESPVAPLLLMSDGASLTGLHLLGGPRDVVPGPDWVYDREPFRHAVAELKAYFAGELTVFSGVLAPSGTTFQLAVWAFLTDIPFGETRSYGDLARRLGKSGASRAVGLANGRNPISIIIPCHRVIGADGSLTGYGGGLARKAWLLRHEATVRARLRGFTIGDGPSGP